MAVPPGEDREGRAAVFLDRDGTLIQEMEYLAHPDGVALLPGAAEGLRLLRDAGFALVVITNQSGIGRGLYGLEDYHAVARRLEELLEGEGVRVQGTYFCPHHPDADGVCECRKPSTGLFRAAAKELELDLARSYFVGDRIRDLLPARALGGTGILVRTGYGAQEEPGVEVDVRVEDDLLAAARWITGVASSSSLNRFHARRGRCRNRENISG
jgi:D-glycero-D-manno-heptose 1,7-bisphosphate phosphatase